MIITIEHPELGPQKTYSTAEVAAAATSTSVENNDGFASGDLALFGTYGIEKSEIVTLTGTTGNTQVDHSAGLTFPHPARTPVRQMLYNQAEISRASSEGGTYSVVTTVTLDVDEQYTIYNDTGGSTSSWYKIRYYNSQTTTYSDYSEEVQGTGYTDNSLYSMAAEILEEFGDPDSHEVPRDRVRNALNGAVKAITTKLIAMYPDFNRTYTTQSLTADTATYSLPDNFLGFVRVDIDFSGSTAANAYKADYEDESYGLPHTSYQQSDPKIAIRGSNFVIRPTPDSSSGTAFIWYWQYPSAMTDDADTHGLPYGAREVLIAYALWRLWMAFDKEKSRSYKSLYDELIESYMEFVGQQRQMMTSKKIDINYGVDLYERQVYGL